MTKNPTVDAWFEKKKHPREEAMQAVCELTLKADPRITESIKWSTTIPCWHKGLEGDGDTARVVRFDDPADVRKRGSELTSVLRACCKRKDG
ncbi:MAG: hypothetical protein ACRDVK_12725 [Acidimicrobiia bacterium]